MIRSGALRRALYSWIPDFARRWLASGMTTYSYNLLILQQFPLAGVGAAAKVVPERARGGTVYAADLKSYPSIHRV
jgi:hypothetical protein